MDTYEKKYKEAIERAKSFKTPELCDVAEYIFPELKESEDERIRKEIINYFTEGREFLSLCSFDREHILAWLEKQGEQDEWTQDDEQYLLICKNALYKYQVSDKWDANIIYGWLKRRIKGK